MNASPTTTSMPRTLPAEHRERLTKPAGEVSIPLGTRFWIIRTGTLRKDDPAFGVNVSTVGGRHHAPPVPLGPHPAAGPVRSVRQWQYAVTAPMNGRRARSDRAWIAAHRERRDDPCRRHRRPRGGSQGHRPHDAAAEGQRPAGARQGGAGDRDRLEADPLPEESSATTTPTGARSCAACRTSRRASSVTAAELMISPALTVGAGTTLAQAARTMARTKVKRLPVVDHAGRLEGVVSRADLLKVFLRDDEQIAEEVRREVVAYLFPGPASAVRAEVQDGVGRTALRPGTGHVPGSRGRAARLSRRGGRGRGVRTRPARPLRGARNAVSP